MYLMRPPGVVEGHQRMQRMQRMQTPPIRGSTWFSVAMAAVVCVLSVLSSAQVAHGVRTTTTRGLSGMSARGPFLQTVRNAWERVVKPHVSNIEDIGHIGRLGHGISATRRMSAMNVRDPVKYWDPINRPVYVTQTLGSVTNPYDELRFHQGDDIFRQAKIRHAVNPPLPHRANPSRHMTRDMHANAAFIGEWLGEGAGMTLPEVGHPDGYVRPKALPRGTGDAGAKAGAGAGAENPSLLDVREKLHARVSTAGAVFAQNRQQTGAPVVVHHQIIHVPASLQRLVRNKNDPLAFMSPPPMTAPPPRR